MMNILEEIKYNMKILTSRLKLEGKNIFKNWVEEEKQDFRTIEFKWKVPKGEWKTLVLRLLKRKYQGKREK